MTTQDTQTPKFSERYPNIPFQVSILLDPVYTLEELGLMMRASGLLWSDQLPTDPTEAAEALGITTELWNDRATRLMWNTFKNSVSAWKRHNVSKTAKMTANAKAKAEKAAERARAASAVDPTSPEHLAWMASQKGAK
jgi:hypothetical protein